MTAGRRVATGSPSDARAGTGSASFYDAIPHRFTGGVLLFSRLRQRAAPHRGRRAVAARGDRGSGCDARRCAVTVPPTPSGGRIPSSAIIRGMLDGGRTPSSSALDRRQRRRRARVRAPGRRHGLGSRVERGPRGARRDRLRHATSGSRQATSGRATPATASSSRATTSPSRSTTARSGVSAGVGVHRDSLARGPRVHLHQLPELRRGAASGTTRSASRDAQATRFTPPGGGFEPRHGSPWATSCCPRAASRTTSPPRAPWTFRCTAGSPRALSYGVITQDRGFRALHPQQRHPRLRRDGGRRSGPPRRWRLPPARPERRRADDCRVALCERPAAPAAERLGQVPRLPLRRPLRT